jgi:ferredoxin
MSRLDVRVEDSRCVRCGACAALAPEVFDLSAGPSRVRRQPTAAEQAGVEVARWICPTDAVRARVGDDDGATEPASPFHDGAIYGVLAVGAESLRWNLADVPWSELDPKRAPPDLKLVVREMAFSENATYSATQRFLDAFGEDVEFTKWVSVWFYEETRHPHVLIEWLRRAGEDVPADFVVRGRVSTPLMRSLVGTLVTNIVSEITASQAYRYLARTSPEPVLARIATSIAGDEARHAASFFRFARARLTRTPPVQMGRERARALEVLHAWLHGSGQVTHPVQQMFERLAGAPDGSPLDLDFESVRLRAVRVVGLLLDLPLRRIADVEPAVRQAVAEARRD